MLSPGPCSPKEAGICIDIVEHFKGKKTYTRNLFRSPNYWTCFWRRYYKSTTACAWKVYSINHTNKGVFRGLKNPLNVTRYHSLIVDSNTVPKELEITAITDKGEIMGIRHKKYLIEGVQFHPEAILSEYGHEMLKNFITEARERVHM